MTIICSKCKKPKEQSDFHPGTWKKGRGWCKPCKLASDKRSRGNSKSYCYLESWHPTRKNIERSLRQAILCLKASHGILEGILARMTREARTGNSLSSATPTRPEPTSAQNEASCQATLTSFLADP